MSLKKDKKKLCMMQKGIETNDIAAEYVFSFIENIKG